MAKMLSRDDITKHAQEVANPATGVERKVELLREVREGMEITQTGDYEHFLVVIVAPLLGLLSGTPPQAADTPVQRMRHLALEVLSRLPANQLLHKYVRNIMATIMALLPADNDENVTIVLRMLTELHKTFRQRKSDSVAAAAAAVVDDGQPPMEQHVGPYLEFVKRVFENLPVTYNELFVDGLAKPEEAVAKLAFQPAHKSIKVAIDCPVVVMVLYTQYGPVAQGYMGDLVKAMISALSLPGPPDEVPTKLKAPLADLKQAQVKCVSFLTWLMRVYPAAIITHRAAVTDALVHLLRTAPDVVSIRKELLVAMRHTLSLQQVREFYYPKLDELLVEEVLVGRSAACREALRPLALSMLAELIHHVRVQLEYKQLVTIVHIFSRNLHDGELPLAVQSTCVRLMLNLVEVIMQRRQGTGPPALEAFRQLVASILTTLSDKLASVARHTPALLAEGMANREERVKKRDQLLASDEARKAGGASRPRMIVYSQAVSEKEKVVAESRNMVQTLVMGMKSLLYTLSSFGNTIQRAAAAGQQPPTSFGLREDEIFVAVDVITYGLPALRLFGNHKAADGSDVYELFADIFIALNQPRDAMEIFTVKMPLLFDAMSDDVRLLSTAAKLADARPNNPPLPILNEVSRHFCTVLAAHLVEHRLDLLQDPEDPGAVLVLRLFGLVFETMAKYNQKTDDILLLVFPKLISRTQELAAAAKNPSGFLRLQLTLFRSISSGKFLDIYTAFASGLLLTDTIAFLTAMLHAPPTTADKVLEPLITPFRMLATAPLSRIVILAFIQI